MSQFFIIMTILLVIVDHMAKRERFIVRLLIKTLAVIFFVLLFVYNPFFFAAVGWEYY